MWSLEPHQVFTGLPLDYVTSSKVHAYFSKDYTQISITPGSIPDTVIACIEAYNKKIGSGSRVFENIEKLKEYPPVVTGQQPCLVTGPLYVVYKALTAIILAEKFGTVPVFWNASEDDDTSEVNHIQIINNRLEKISIELEKKPFYTIKLQENSIKNVINRIKSLTPPTEFRENILRVINAHSGSFSQMFSRIMSTLFSEYGLIMVEPYIFSREAVPVYETLLKEPTKASLLVNRTGTQLENKGYTRQLHKPENVCNFYVVQDETRCTVEYNSNFHINGTEYTKKELLELLHETPEKFLSNVISRPLVQDYLFNTVAYCAGPGEISYFAQMKDVYTYCNIEQPYIVPRWGATLIESKVKKVLDKYTLKIPELRHPNRIIKEMAKKETVHVFNNTRKNILKEMHEIQETLSSIDPNLKRSTAAARTTIINELNALEEKTARSLKDQNNIMKSQITKAFLNIFPNHKLQERVLNIFQYMIRYPDIIDTVYNTFKRTDIGTHCIVHPGD
ncbi:MAG: bacillithiol biosynthesis cysteine-adding enzyme BshC [Candidatus Methanofastidiosia archaeon]|jgi:bacillithiol biosynthesis cysteine-adding enzyme BshC